jgi:transposase
LDNARIHHARSIDFNGFNQLFFPPYSPFLNPIENCFSKWKNSVRRSTSNNRNELFGNIENGFNSISSNDCIGYWNNMLRYLNLSHSRMNINH